jgi:hypothetical protein
MNIGVWFAVAIAIFIAIYYGNKAANKKNKDK